jgi:hypothetical protein
MRCQVFSICRIFLVLDTKLNIAKITEAPSDEIFVQFIKFVWFFLIV